MEINIKDLLSTVIKENASDLHLLAGVAPTIRVDGILAPLPHFGALSPQIVEELTFSLVSPEQKELILVNKELDFSLPFQDEKGTTGRFRANVYYQKGTVASEFRYIPSAIRTV